jgi:hypothetical protein
VGQANKELPDVQGDTGETAAAVVLVAKQPQRGRAYR